MTKQTLRETRLGVATAACGLVLAITLNLLLGPNLARDAGLLLTSILLASWIGGQTSGIVATALCLVGLASFLVSRDRVSFSFRESGLWQLASFLLVASTLNFINAARRRAERRLHLQEERFGLFMENLPGAAWMKDVDGRYVYANDEALRILAVERKDLYAHTDDDVFEPEIARQHKANDRLALAHRATIETLEELTQSDGLHHSIVAKFPLLDFDGRPAFVAGMAIDITERNRVERALERERELLEKVFETIPVMIVLYDPSTKVQRVNSEFAKVTGWPKEEASTLDLMAACYPDPEYRESARQFMQSLSPEWRDWEIVTRDGRKIETTWSNIRLSDDTQVGIGIDISERKSGELRLQNLVHELERANNAKDEFLGLVSHELRTPLTVIMGFANLLCRRGEEMTPSDRHEAHLDLRHESERLAQIIENLLVLARLDRGQAVEIETLMLGRIIDSVADEFSRWHPSRKLGVCECQELPLVRGCQVYVEQVLRNLLTNANKYSPAEGSVEIEAGSEGSSVVISVLDRGPGLAEKDREKIFEPFYRAQTSQNHEVQGFGIGLSACRRLVDSMGGKIWVQPRDGGGSAFCFTLPAEELELAAPDRAVSTST